MDKGLDTGMDMGIDIMIGIYRDILFVDAVVIVARVVVVVILAVPIADSMKICNVYISQATHKLHLKLALIPCGIKAGILRRGRVESCQSVVKLPLLLLNR
jgi:hypothetical protein